MKKIIILLSIICLVALSGCNNYDYYTYADLVDCNEGQYKIDDAEKERLTLKYERNKFMGEIDSYRVRNTSFEGYEKEMFSSCVFEIKFKEFVVNRFGIETDGYPTEMLADGCIESYDDGVRTSEVLYYWCYNDITPTLDMLNDWVNEEDIDEENYETFSRILKSYYNIKKW